MLLLRAGWGAASFTGSVLLLTLLCGTVVNEGKTERWCPKTPTKVYLLQLVVFFANCEDLLIWTSHTETAP